MEETARFRSSFAFMLIGIDHLARLQRRLGSRCGLTRSFLKSQSAFAHVCAVAIILGRFSGNKFGLILKNCTVDDMKTSPQSGFSREFATRIVPAVRTCCSYGNDRRHQCATPCPHGEEAMTERRKRLDLAKGRRRGSMMVLAAEHRARRAGRVNIRLPTRLSRRSMSAAS